jgi:hypothetical protein
MTTFLAEQAEPIQDATRGEQGRRPTRDRQAARPPGLGSRRLTEVHGSSASDQNPPCSAVLLLAGRPYQCDLPTDSHGRHDDWRHSSKAAEAVWCDDAATEWHKPAVPLTLKDIGDMHGAISWGETAMQYWKGRAEAAEAALVKAVEQLRRHQTTSDYEQGYEHGAASATKAYVLVQAERDELRAKIARIEVLAHLFETVPSRRLMDAVSSDIRDVPNGHAQPELE